MVRDQIGMVVLLGDTLERRIDPDWCHDIGDRFVCDRIRDGRAYDGCLACPASCYRIVRSPLRWLMLASGVVFFVLLWS